MASRRSIWIGTTVICFSMQQGLQAQERIYTGNQAANGANPPDSPPTYTIRMYDILGEVFRDSAPAVSLRNNSAQDLLVETAQTGAPFNIRTTGSNGKGISVMSVGTPSAPTSDPFFGIPIPSSQNVSGGVVVVRNRANINTSGSDAQGIHAQSSTSGFPPQVTQQLNDFITQNKKDGFSFSVTGVKNSNNTNGTVGSAVTATRVDASGAALTNPAGGQVTLSSNGNFTFSDNGELADVAVGATVNVRVNYTITITKTTVNPNVTQVHDGFVILSVKKTGTNAFDAPQVVGSNFSVFGSTAAAVFPSLNNYVANLLATTGSGGAGNSVTVTNDGNITTTGQDSHGILATSQGSNGGNGRNASIPDSSTQGGNGSTGGMVTVTANGSITTTRGHTAGVVAWSLGGSGGKGGDSGYTRNSKRGGDGAAGGNVFVHGNGVITTSGFESSGIIALSEGGRGGAGGAGSTFNSADDGGSGGQGGNVVVDGSWTIRTSGDDAHGIWGKSMGGVAGGGGNGGWTGTGAGGGGAGTSGGDVSITSNGAITTSGSHAYGIYGESIGGFSGSGGSGTSIFYASGGSSASAGSGGNVFVQNGSGGVITTTGTSGHGIFAQSVGGGGGSGGSGGALVGLGGSGSMGGDGGNVEVRNQGNISASGAGARGIYAQSVGGGGGDGGAGTGLVAVGGSGSGTSDGGQVTVTNTGTIISSSSSIFAQSIGGGGGNGGSSLGWFSFGGTAGGGGDASNVVVNSRGNLTTSADNASAIFAQSVGGGGGNGGNSTAVGTVATLAIGGKAGSGGDGSDVQVGSDSSNGTVTGIIRTSGDFSRGIQAQSVGGGGGNGGFAASLSVNPGGGGTAIGIGGQGGDGGEAGNVRVFAGDAATRITTDGKDSHGIFAQSVGGGGGSGGFAIAASAGVGFSASVGAGGAGGKGGDAGTVNVGSLQNFILGDILTQDIHSYGIFAQSVGGGGGDGGFSIAGSLAVGGASGSLSIGGNAADGGDGKSVNLYSGANVFTQKADSHAIFAQSVGGGGGSGGFSVAGGIGGTAVNLGFGGTGGKGGDAGDVVLHSTGQYVSTSGSHSYGVIAQSVGGGGGDGGFSVAAGISAAPSLGFSMGGAGASGGVGGNVRLTNASAILTDGVDSHGLFAQSVGGGGGSGGFSVAASISFDPTGAGAGAALNASFGGSGAGGGQAGNVILSNSASIIQTNKARSYGIFAQSVGGGGGDGGFSVAGSISNGPAVSFSMGGSGGGGSLAGSVDLDSDGDVATFGEKSHAVVAQSVGGGGGTGGFSVAGSISTGSGAAAVSASIGGEGGTGGHGGDVTAGKNAAITGNITTDEDDSYGILVQSVGGSGGDGGFSVGAGISASAAVNFSMGGSGGTAGNAGVVKLNSAASVGTKGNNSHAIFAQSIGGGGGSGGFSVTGSVSSGSGQVGASIGGFGDGGGDGRSVTVNSTGVLITTEGNHADGIHAQSIGGGGGDGGFSVAGGISKSTSASFSIGGFGDGGGNGQLVDVTNSSDIRTLGEGALGIFAQSLGGGGGSGGFSVAGTVSTESNGVAFSMGGFGGSGGTGGEVKVKNTGNISTGGVNGNGKGSHGILAQSVGGGGGDGGFSGSFSASLSGQNGSSVGVSIGGFGDSGGDSSWTDLINEGMIETLADDSVALFAQSVGGGGGNGGFSLAASLSASTEKGSMAVSIGGHGSGGGDGGRVTVTNSDQLSTKGDHSQGIFAQSVGGGGGNGGFSVAASGASGKQATNLSVSVGGFGGAGGDGKQVTVTNNASIFTEGDESSAIQAQSIGGGGGNGGLSISGSFTGPEGKSASISIGGNGSDGGMGGLVEVLGGTSNVVLSTKGVNSYGVLAQSIGGGGGTGGLSGSIAFGVGGNDATKPSTSISVSVGGDGGAGNIGGEVRVGTASDRFKALIVTTDHDSAGIFAQSIGGGGGTGGYSISGSFNLASGNEGPNNNAAIAVGGGGGIGNHGGAVGVYHEGDIGTDGDGSHGIHAQSIGGGGGSGGGSRAMTLQLGQPPTPEEKAKAAKNKALSLSIGGDGAGGGDGGEVTIVNEGDIFTSGADAHGIYAQSVGGGGGSGGDAHFSFDGALALKKYDRASFLRNLKIVVGGSGGSSGNGKLVDVTHTGDITTTGLGSSAIYAQSIGGGGGNGGAGAVGLVGTIGVGGGTGTTGDGGAVNVTFTGDINTYEDAAEGIMAQSIGGGGGRAGNVDRGLKNYLNVGIGLAFGQGGGNAGDGGNVTVLSEGDITTRGVASNGIWAQSVGGGGGVAGQLGNDMPVLNVLNFAGSTGGAGSGGGVDIDHTGNISTGGDASDGIWAQSAGGVGNGGEVGIRIDGSIITSGEESNGIFAQSVGTLGKGDINIEIASGIIQGGKNTGSGIHIKDGADNLVVNRGTLQSFGLIQGTAITADLGNETVDNHGTVNGNVLLGAGTNTFIHRTGALLRSGDKVDLGAGNQFRNSGTISVGDLNDLQSTILTGDLVQAGDAIWFFDFQPDFLSDRFTVDGSTSLGAHVNTINLNQMGIASSEGRSLLIAADDGLIGDFRFGSLYGGTMPVGITFTLINTSTALEMDLATSTGDFYWRGATGNTWNGAFVDGESNWTRTGAGTDYIYGTPGDLVDVFFMDVASPYRDTILGADFSVNSLTFQDPGAVSINGTNDLTIAAAGGRGVTVRDGAGEVRVTTDVILGADQTWLNDGDDFLLVSGDTITGADTDLTVDGSGTTIIYADIFTGTGSLTKAGNGMLAVFGASNFTGGTFIDGGLLEAGEVHSLGSGNVVLSQGVLRTINDRSAAANTPLHLDINGAYTQRTPTELQLRIIGPSGVSDRLDVAGPATLGGTFRPDYSSNGYDPVPPAGDYTDEFLIVHADGGIVGEFEGFIDVHYNPDRLLRWEPVYEANDVFLLWNQHPFTDLPGLTDNQYSTADVLNRATGLIPAIPTPYNDSTGPALDAHPGLRTGITYLNNRSLADLPVDYDLIAPDELTAIFDAGRSFTQVQVGNIENRLQEIRDGGGSGFSARGLHVQKTPVSFSAPMPVAPSAKDGGISRDSIYTPRKDNPWGVFIAGSAENMGIGGDGNARGFDVETSGVTVGIDLRPNEYTAIGLFEQYTNSDADLVGDGRVDREGMKFGIYGTVHNEAGFYLNGLIAAGVSDYDTRRAALGGFANGSTDGWDYDGMIGGGYTARTGGWTYGPLATLTYSRQQIDQFTETGSMLPLVIEDQYGHSLTSRVGFEVSYEFQVGEIFMVPRLSVAWEHEFLQDYEVDARLAAAAQNGFTTSGATIGRDSVDIRAGLGVQWNDRFSTHVSYQCELARSNYSVHSFSLGLHLQF